MEKFKLIFEAFLDMNRFGKLTGLFLICLAAYLILGLLKGFDSNSEKKRLVTYMTVVSIIIIFPLTSLAVKKYMTPFYQYRAMWGLLPVYFFIALVLTEIIFAVKEKTERKTFIGFLLGVCAILFFAGGQFASTYDSKAQMLKRNSAIKVLNEIDVCNGDLIWGPKEIMEQACNCDRNVTTIYGRDMWQPELKGYIYDEYNEDEKILFSRMESLSEPVENVITPEADGFPFVTKARDMGVDIMILPGTTPEWFVDEVKIALGEEPSVTEGYYIFNIN
ncbi:MAG: hypothetical protein K6F84_07755 [Lachnospiraceae bacterium]|nr:hypothetical protein [Lachnospiraceae bacterium]